LKVRIDANLCQGHTMCVLACPDVFLVNDEDGHAYVADEQVEKKFEEAIRLAVKSCPERAIQIDEE
jgi:ferredoxin